jgi:hypothetical protein
VNALNTIEIKSLSAARRRVLDDYGAAWVYKGGRG